LTVGVRHRLSKSCLLAGLIAAALVVGASAALAAHGDAQKKLTPADSARARSMLLRKADLGPGFKASTGSSDDPHLYCKALDESDLTLTGDAESPDFERGLVFVSSTAQVYESVADANASWKRGTSAAGERCARELLRGEFAKDAIRLVSMRRVAFPRVSQRTVAYRVQLTSDAQGTTVKVVMDVVVLMRSRAQAALLLGSAFVPVPRADEVRLARLVASRMTKATRNS